MPACNVSESRLAPGRALVAVWLALAGAHPQASVAQEEPDNLGEEILLDDVPSVFSASKYEQKVTQAPAAVSIVTEDEIRRYGYRTLGEVMASVVGLYTTNDRNYTYAGVRGLGIAGDYNSRVLVLIDGHRVNDSVYSSSLIAQEFPLDVELIDRVEIVRGATSALYGNNAFFAVVNVITKRGRDYQGGELGASYGSDVSYQTRGVYGRRLANGLELMASASYFGSDGKRRLYYPEFDDPATNFGIAEDADAEAAERYFAQLAYGGLALRMGYGSRNKQVPTAPYGGLFVAPGTETTDSYAWFDAAYRTELGADWSAELRSYWDRYSYRGNYVYDAALAPPPEPVDNVDGADAQRVGGGLTIDGKLGARHRLSGGLDLVHSYRMDQSNEDINPAFSYFESNEQATDWGFYVQDAVQLWKRLTLLVGARYDDYELSGDDLNPRFGLIWEATDATVLKLLYGTAFRAPAGYELFYNSPLNQKPPDNLEPETIETTEFVLEQQLGESVRFTGSLYYSRIEDLIAIGIDPLDGLLVFANREDRKSFGLESTLEGTWAGGWKGRASWAMQRTEDDMSNSRLPNSPAHQVKLNLIAPLFGERLFAATELQYTSNRETVYGTDAGDVFLTNLTLDAPDLVGQVSLQAGIRNLFDELYFDPGSTEHVQPRIEQNGRTLFVSGRLSF